jgi:Uma2 family endonuclease
MAAMLIQILGGFVEQHQLGFVLGEAAPLRYAAGLIREPDVSYFSWSRFPKRKLPGGPFLNMAPDLAAEVLSPGNKRREMARKRRECFSAGTKLVWEIEPRRRAIAVYSSPNCSKTIDEDGVLDGGKVIPGFRLSVRELFERAGVPEAL